MSTLAFSTPFASEAFGSLAPSFDKPFDEPFAPFWLFVPLPEPLKSAGQRIARWTAIVLKIFVVLDVERVKSKAKHILRKEAYLRIFNQVTAAAADSELPRVFRVIGGMLVGK